MCLGLARSSYTIKELWKFMKRSLVPMTLTLPRQKTIWLINVAYPLFWLRSILPFLYVFVFSVIAVAVTYVLFSCLQVEKHYRRALEIYTNKFGIDDPNVAKTLTSLVCLSFIFNLLKFGFQYILLRLNVASVLYLWHISQFHATLIV